MSSRAATCEVRDEAAKGLDCERSLIKMGNTDRDTTFNLAHHRPVRLELGLHSGSGREINPLDMLKQRIDAIECAFQKVSLRSCGGWGGMPASWERGQKATHQS